MTIFPKNQPSSDRLGKNKPNNNNDHHKNHQFTDLENSSSSQTFYNNANSSMMSFETIATTERLLDKLDLSIDDEEILKQALLEEETKKQQTSEKYNFQASAPASSFVSLRDIQKPHNQRQPIDDKKLEQFKDDFKIKSNNTVGVVQQHAILHNRYSYFVEEESDSDDGDTLRNVMENENKKSLKSYSPNSPFQKKPIALNNETKNSIYTNCIDRNDLVWTSNLNRNIHQTHMAPQLIQTNQDNTLRKNYIPSPNVGNLYPNSHFLQKKPRKQRQIANVVNFEKYRVKNMPTNNKTSYSQVPKSIHPSDLAQPFTPTQYTATHSSKYINIGHRENINPGINLESYKISYDKVAKTQRSQSFETTYITPLSKPNTKSSSDTFSTSISSIHNKQSSNHNLTEASTPTKLSETSSPATTQSFSSSSNIIIEPAPEYKTHKKKQSFSLKSLFRSPKSSKEKRSSSEFLDLNKDQNVNSQLHPDLTNPNLPIIEKKHKFQFGGPLSIGRNPKLNKEFDTNNNNNYFHARSFSDFTDRKLKTKINENTISKIHSNSDVRKNERKYFNGSEFDKSPKKILSNITTGAKEVIQDKIDKTNDERVNEVESGAINKAIRLRNEGHIEESTEILRQACFESNITAFLLYGLALRNGYGVPVNYKQSLYYIKEATGITSFEEQVFKLDINPVILEKESLTPDTMQEPEVPALYEYGIAYLKGLGFDEPNERLGLKCLEKAASLGHIDSMCVCGTIWSKSSTFRKRDLGKAAAWFRIAKGKGTDLIGSDWIYKDKYMNS